MEKIHFLALAFAFHTCVPGQRKRKQVKRGLSAILEKDFNCACVSHVSFVYVLRVSLRLCRTCEPDLRKKMRGKALLCCLRNKCLSVSLVHEYSGVNTLCGSIHFWMVNHPQGNTPTAGISLRSKWGAQNAGISTFGKCGSFKFKIKNIKVLN